MACCKLLANREFKLAAPRPAAAAAPDAPRQTERQNTRSGAAQAATGNRVAAPIGGTSRGCQAVFASLAIAVLGPHGLTGGRPGALPVRLIVAALA